MPIKTMTKNKRPVIDGHSQTKAQQNKSYTQTKLKNLDNEITIIIWNANRIYGKMPLTKELIKKYKPNIFAVSEIKCNLTVFSLK